MAVGQSIPRVDAFAKVTGEAKYTADLVPANAYVAKIVRAPVASGWVRGFDLTEAQAVPGVVRIFTCFDVPLVDRSVPSGHLRPQTAQRAYSRVG